MKVLQHQSNPNTSKRSGFNLVSNQDKTEKDPTDTDRPGISDSALPDVSVKYLH